LKDLLPAERGRRCRPAFDNRQVVDGILWRMRTDSPWREMPAQYGKWSTIYRRFRRWQAAGVWDAAVRALVRSIADGAGAGRDAGRIVSMVRARGALANRLMALLSQTEATSGEQPAQRARAGRTRSGRRSRA
jgi:transposase